MDVNLRMAVWDLREREQKLSEMVEALLVRPPSPPPSLPP
jgi:hypothetical protein